MAYGRISLVLGCLWFAFGAACSTTDDTEGSGGTGGGSGTGAGASGKGGSASGGRGGQATGGSGGTDAGGKGGTVGAAGDSSDAGEGGDGSSAVGGASGSGGSAGKGGGGTGGSAGSNPDPLCDDLVELKEDKANELGCTGSGVAPEREVWGRICSLAGSCMTELEDHYDCLAAATTWSCDTSDGHPQTNGACDEAEFFACFGPAVHEEDPFGCAATAELHNDAADELGCDRDEAFEGNCNQLYLRELCVPEWESLIECLQAGDVSDMFECDMDNALKPQPDACASEHEAYDACREG
jgi:hypothetical protein